MPQWSSPACAWPSTQHRLPQAATNARTVRAVLDLYLAEAAAGRVQLAPKTLVTSRSAANTMSATALSSGWQFGTLQLSKLTWKEIEDLYGSMTANGLGVDWIRPHRCRMSRAAPAVSVTISAAAGTSTSSYASWARRSG
jgi:hypothetical protein